MSGWPWRSLATPSWAVAAGAAHGLVQRLHLAPRDVREAAHDHLRDRHHVIACCRNGLRHRLEIDWRIDGPAGGRLVGGGIAIAGLVPHCGATFGNIRDAGRRIICGAFNVVGDCDLLCRRRNLRSRNILVVHRHGLGNRLRIGRTGIDRITAGGSAIHVAGLCHRSATVGEAGRCGVYRIKTGIVFGRVGGLRIDLRDGLNIGLNTGQDRRRQDKRLRLRQLL